MTAQEERLPETVERAVRAMCADYDRRAEELRRAKLAPEVLGHYMMINALIDNAIALCCEESIRKEMRRDIGNGTGHRFTKLYFLAPGTYKSRKRKSKLAIAHALHLL